MSVKFSEATAAAYMNERLAARFVVTNLESKGLRRTGLGTLGRIWLCGVKL
jgi:hypothetical protein